MILRDGQVEVRVFVDIEHWLEQLQDTQNWLLGHTEHLLSDADLTSPTLHQDLSKLIAKNTTLTLDGQTLLLENASRTYNSAEAISKVRRTEYRLSGRHTNPTPTNLTIQLPASLGDAAISVARPIYGSAKSGESKAFSLQRTE